MSNKPDYVYGIHAVRALLETEPDRIIEGYVLRGRDDEKLREIISAFKRYDLTISEVTRKALDEKVFGGTHQGIVVRVKSMKEHGEHELLNYLDEHKNPFLLILDNVTDPHNLGACLRNCDGAGVDAVIVPKDNSAPLSGVVRKVACGAAETIPVFYVTNLARIMRELRDRNIWIVGTAGETDKMLYDTDMTGSLAVVMGAEETGMRRLTRENCDVLVKIPMYGKVTSLNVSVATGIVLYEAVRQRLLKK